MMYKRIPVLVVLLIALTLPFVADVSSIATEVLLLAGAAAAWNLFSGYTGYISLGQAAYYGIGAYVMTLACQDWHLPGGYALFLLLPLAGVVAGAFSLPLGWVALHTRRYTFMVITIAIFFLFQLLAYNLSGFTGGSSGIFLPVPTWSADLGNVPFYYTALALVLLIIFVSRKLSRTQYGLILSALRDDEDHLSALGHQTTWYKLSVYVLSAFFTGMIGAMAAYFAGFISPSVAFDQTLDITIITMTFFGGFGTLWGPIVGGLLLEPIQAYLTQQFGTTAPSLTQMLFGAMLLAVLLLFPRGVIPAFQKRWRMWRGSPQQIEPALAFSNGTHDISLQATDAFIPAAAHSSPNWQVISPGAAYPMEQFEPLYAPTLSGPLKPLRMRSSRLIPIVNPVQPVLEEHDEPPTLEESMPPLPVSWRCPNCKIPFLLNGDTCYCRRCGLTRWLGSLPPQ